MHDQFSRLVSIMSRLRNPVGGCPWDLKQTHQTLKPYLIEEAYEVLEAIDLGQMDALCEELGDLLLQVVFHAQLASERGDFTVEDVAQAISDKLVRRHPHVFGEVKVDGADEVVTNWEKIKLTEKQGKTETPSLLSGVPRHFPGLLQAQRLQDKASKAKFDWPGPEPVLEKIQEELAELAAARQGGEQAEIAEEVGDLLFSVVNLARHLGVDAEEAVGRTSQKFKERFQFMERHVQAAGQALEELSPEEQDQLWRHAKHRLAQKGDPKSVEIGEAPQVLI